MAGGGGETGVEAKCLQREMLHHAVTARHTHSLAGMPRDKSEAGIAHISRISVDGQRQGQ